MKNKSVSSVEDTKGPLELLTSGKLVKICAPMVRYSKLPFRSLVRQYDCDMAFTPMIIANSFVQSSKARDNEFTTNEVDRPLIVQFAANNAEDFANASQYVCKYSDGVDLNCGCPQRWALKEGYGACLLNKPQLIRDIVLQTRNKIPLSDFTISLKIRIHSDIKKTVDFCQKAEHAGISWLTVHSRTAQQRKEPINVSALGVIKDSLAIPVVANGDVFKLEDAVRLHKQTRANGIMAARGLLRNPAMFSGFDLTPKEVVQEWVNIALSQKMHFTQFHHHLVFMLEKILPRKEKKIFNVLRTVPSAVEYLYISDFLEEMPEVLPQDEEGAECPIPDI